MRTLVKMRRATRRELSKRSDRELAAFERAGRLTWWGCVKLAWSCGWTVYRESRAAGRAHRAKS